MPVREIPVTPRGIITTDRPLSPVQAENILRAFERMHARGGPILLHSGLQYTELQPHECARTERCAYCTSRLWCHDRHCKNCGAPA